MTVAEFLRKNLMMGSEVLDVVDVWSNEACCDYLIRAMENAGFDHTHIMTALRGMHRAFDELTIEEAEAVYQKW